MNNPGSILKLWVKAVKVHEADKDPKALPKKGQEQKTRVKKGLVLIKSKGAADLTAPANAEKFIALRDKVGKVMTKYCRYLKAAKDEDKKVLPKYLKTVKRLTALVLKLNPGNLSQDEEDPNLESLEGVDDAAVDKALEAPDTDTDADDDLDLDQDEAPPTRPAPPRAPAPPRPQVPAAEQAAAFKARLQALLAQLKQAEAAGAPGVAEARAHLTAATQLGAKELYNRANLLLDQAQLALGQAGLPPGGDDTAAEWKTKLAGWTPAIKTALAARGPNAAAIAKLFAEANSLAKPGGDLTQALAKLTECHKLVTQTANPPASAMKRFNALTPTVKTALTAGGPNLARIQTLVGTVAGLLKNNDLVQASKVLDELEPLLQPAAGTGAKDLAAEWKTKLAEYTPTIKTAMTVKGPNAAGVGQLLAQANALAKPGGDLTQALAKLAECHKRAAADAAAHAAWKSRVAALEPRVLEAQKARAGEMQWLAMFMTAQDLGGAGKFAKARTVLDRLESRLNAPAAQPGTTTAGAVDYAKLLLRWRDAQKRAAANLTELGRQLLALPEVQADPRLAEVQRAAAGLPDLVPKFSEELADHLDAAANGGPNAAASRQAALVTISAYRNQLAAAPVLAKLADFGRKNLKAEFPSAAELDAALGEIAAALAAAK